MNLFRRNRRRLPGTLCDETPMVPQEQRGKWNAGGRPLPTRRIPVHEVPEPRDDSEYDQGDQVSNEEYAAIRARDIADARAFDQGGAIEAEPATPKKTEQDTIAYLNREVTSLRAQLAEQHRLGDDYLAICQQLREITADRDQLSAANGLLVAKVRELTAALGHDTTGA